MTKLFINIGTEKTGTTYLQTLSKNNKELLIDNQKYYLNEKGLIKYIINYAKYQQNVEEIQSIFDSIPKKKEMDLFIVSEFFYRDIKNHEEVKRLKTLLDSLNINYELIVYLRPQIEWLLSFYSTYIKNGGIKFIEEFIENKLSKKDMSLHYKSRIELWHETFQNNFHVRSYKDIMLKGKGLKENFFNYIGVPEDIIDLLNLDNINKNESLDQYLLEQLRISNIRMNLEGHTEAEIKRKLNKRYIKIFNSLYHDYHPIKKELTNIPAIIKVFKKDNDYIKKNFDIDLDFYNNQYLELHKTKSPSFKLLKVWRSIWKS